MGKRRAWVFLFYHLAIIISNLYAFYFYSGGQGSPLAWLAVSPSSTLLLWAHCWTGQAPSMLCSLAGPTAAEKVMDRVGP